MKLRTLTKRNQIGVRNIHVFINDVTGDVVCVPCSKADYDLLGSKDGSKFNPIMAGHTYDHSEAGSIEYDTHNGIPNVGDYVEHEGLVKAYIMMSEIKEVENDTCTVVRCNSSEIVNHKLDLDTVELFESPDERSKRINKK